MIRKVMCAGAGEVGAHVITATTFSLSIALSCTENVERLRIIARSMSRGVENGTYCTLLKERQVRH